MEKIYRRFAREKQFFANDGNTHNTIRQAAKIGRMVTGGGCLLPVLGFVAIIGGAIALILLIV